VAKIYGINIISFKTFMVCLATGPKTRAQLVEETGLAYATVIRWLSVVRAKSPLNLVHRAAYPRNTRCQTYIEYFALGPGLPDCPKGTPLPIPPIPPAPSAHETKESS
jgi:hypothetical protein